MTLIDVIWTTMSMRHAGPITGYVSHWNWQLFRGLSGAIGRSRPLLYAGPTILFGTLLGWVLLSWTGWLLVFSANEASVLGKTEGVGPAAEREEDVQAEFLAHDEKPLAISCRSRSSTCPAPA